MNGNPFGSDRQAYNDNDDRFIEREYLMGGVQMGREDFEGGFKDGRNFKQELSREKKQGESRNQGKFYGKGPKGWKYSDTKIRDDVSEALYENYDVDASDIEVSVNEGTVYLRGFIDSREAKREAERCLEHIPGVQDIQNELRVKRSEDILKEMLD